MIMDPKDTELSDNYTKSSKLDEQTIFLNSENQYPSVKNGYKFDTPTPDLNFMNIPFYSPDSDPDSFGLSFNFSPGGESFAPSVTWIPDEGASNPSSGWSPDWEPSSPYDDSDSSDPVLRYINQMLMEENMEDNPPMFYDPFALKATEQSLYDVLGEQYPSSPNSSWPYINHIESPNNKLSGSGSDYGGNTNTSTSISSATATVISDFVDSQVVGDAGELRPSLSQASLPGHSRFQSNMPPSLQFPENPSNGLLNSSYRLMGSAVSEMAQNMFTDRESVLQFQRGLEEASKFLPSASQLIIDLESNTFSTREKGEFPAVVVKEKVERESSPNGSRGRKNHEREDLEFEGGRSTKQSAVYVEDTRESELSELFDKVLLWPSGKDKPLCCNNEAEESVARKTSQPDEQSNGSSGGKNLSEKQGKMKTVDLRALLILCAQAVSTSDFRTANELLKQIRQHSSPFGDGSQRLAHFFANGIEARLAGDSTGIQNFYTSITLNRTTAADKLKAYKIQLQSSPFKTFSMVFANQMICRAAEKATTLHIVDFGVLYGFQWPMLIQDLSTRHNGPPKLRITGIELPQNGFRPAERIKETGHRLAKYCERFNVPFEYHPLLAQNWESITIEDLKINTNEVLAVNCLFRFQNLLDETVEVNCPRNAVLNLIRRMNPNIFVHTSINGSYNSPFFVTRFREALFHYSSLFDMFDSTLSREDEERLIFEREFYGREAVNVIACEGPERVERPETYRQWQVRTMRAGFKQLPLDQELMHKFRKKLTGYHKDFVIDEDSHWMLQGWKGRIIIASSCWVPA